jgi:pimeloyl-ACP methyl ester carboxylesterase
MLGRMALILCLGFAAAAFAQDSGHPPAPAPPPQDPGLHTDVVFTRSGPLSSNREIGRRALTPLTWQAVLARAKAVGVALTDQPVDVARERFLLYVPRRKPAQGYELLVFIPPWEDAQLPLGWSDALDQHGTILVAAVRSGNAQTTLGRRMPLAILGALNVMASFPVDPERVFVGGLSGGSRVALRTALAFPDLFRGAFLNAGSDPIGDPELTVPPRDLFRLFQTRTRLVLVTGDQDGVNFDKDRATLASTSEWCVSNAEIQSEPNRGHEPAPAGALARALDRLEAPRADPPWAAQCRQKIEDQLQLEIDALRTARQDGETAAAQRIRARLDSRYGGLAEAALGAGAAK